ncbi:eukaryotic translation initiation factor 1A [Capsaspora owczarzaki ATCC 30864]|uniref:Eukaryotic translation initiation factor 1A n=1 Tax=Capsaspora owczarzaki (strain ATCC 30864) TaxID=595528 RepID=A0A0D2WP26_CAPO3|nr:eukaryotic translation initiation factor 1A [Capsaspora owczarzaki ATCC 30864]KJE92328.1 eukaryotic translation initiation factor 1A [Capsaspora owczarzaki ATCC 30864]|eukprot:XP_004364155.1 eukaryotic translation initiation factor 1A [Capsaspora owczarzaki ATCC 30864]
MSSATKLKYVAREVLDELPVPSGPNEHIVRVIATRGNNLHEVEFPDGQRILCMMPTKFRKKIWIKRGDYLIAQKLEGSEKLNLRVQAEINHVLYPDQLKELRAMAIWPERFRDAPVSTPASAEAQSVRKEAQADGNEDENDDSDEENDDDLFQNPNRRRYGGPVDPEDEDDDEDDEDDDGNNDEQDQ